VGVSATASLDSGTTSRPSFTGPLASRSAYLCFKLAVFKAAFGPLSNSMSAAASAALAYQCHCATTATELGSIATSTTPARSLSAARFLTLTGWPP
jgi:hypothetical protein